MTDSSEFTMAGPDPPVPDTPDKASRRAHYRIMSDPSLSPADKRQRLLELGMDRLGVENGHVVQIDREAGRHEIVSACGSDIVQEGTETGLANTYCRRTITEEDVLTLYNAPKQGWDDVPATDGKPINCYIGTKLLIGDDLFGTLCFVNAEPRADLFTSEERAFVDLLGSSISRLLERRRHAKALTREQEWFHLFVDEVSDYAIFMLDPAGYVVSWNQGAEQIKGYTEAEISDEHFSRFYTEADRADGRPEQMLQRAHRTGRAQDEGWRVRKDGSRFWALVSITPLYDDEGTLRGFGKVTRDLTERRQARQALESEQAFIERALNALDDIFFVLSTDGEIERVNQRVMDVTGYSEAEVLAMEPVEFFIPEDRQPITEGIAEALETGQTTVDASILTKDDERHRYEFRVQCLEDPDGSPTGLVGVGRDITERTLYEERLEVAQRVLRHNLRNDLNVIRGWVETLGDPTQDTPDDAVNRILSTIDRLVNLSEKTRQMTELAPLTGGEAPTTDVEAAVTELVESFRERNPDATIDLGVDAAESLRVAIDDRFHTAVRNAIQNAIEHNPAPEPWVGVTVEQVDGHVQVRIEDDGPGIPEMEQRVLETGEESPVEHGSGIGLWLVHWCVTTVGGDVAFDSREPSGSAVTLRFPSSRPA